MLSALIPGTTAQECYARGKLLKLRKASAEAARINSLRLINESANSINQKKIPLAIQKFIGDKLKREGKVSLAQVYQFTGYIDEIVAEYASFVKVQENL